MYTVKLFDGLIIICKYVSLVTVTSVFVCVCTVQSSTPHHHPHTTLSWWNFPTFPLIGARLAARITTVVETYYTYLGCHYGDIQYMELFPSWSDSFLHLASWDKLYQVVEEAKFIVLQNYPRPN